MKRVAIVPLILILAVLAGIALPRGGAHAQPPPPPVPGYDIEVQMLYCLHHNKPCNTFSTIRNSEYIQAEAVSFVPGKTRGTPSAVDLTCGRAYIDKQGVFHDVAEHVFAGFNKGTITGTAELERNFTEQSTHAVGEMHHIHAVDLVTGDSGWANGRLVSNNVTDLRVAGWFSIELHGPIYDESHPLTGPGVTKVVGNGEVECNSYGVYQKTNQFHASGPFFEATLGNTDND